MHRNWRPNDASLMLAEGLSTRSLVGQASRRERAAPARACSALTGPAAACSAGSIRHRTSLERGHGCGKPRGRVIRLIHRHFGVSYFIQIRKSARSNFITTGRLAPSSRRSSFVVRTKTPADPAGVFFLSCCPDLNRPGWPCSPAAEYSSISAAARSAAW
jgi:hypothetical protein